MNRLQIPVYIEDLDSLINCSSIDWGLLRDKTVAVSGATGMIGACLIDCILHKNAVDKLNCTIIALGRSLEKAKRRLPYFDDPHFLFYELNIGVDAIEIKEPIDFILHLASSTHPRAYASDPVGTIRANIDGLQSLLLLGGEKGARVLFASSVEVYGENRGDVERFDEKYCGYIDCNTLRACYTESKRLGESMCQAYIAQTGADVVIARIARAYGPTLLSSDSKALSQFIHKALAGEDVVLKSAGTQRFSYLYVADVVSGVLHVLLNGTCGEAYNLADPKSDITLKDLACKVAETAGVNVVFDLPDAQESAGYSKATLALMDGSKAEALGWSAESDFTSGIAKTLEALKNTDSFV